jgi:hypothetical protein
MISRLLIGVPAHNKVNGPGGATKRNGELEGVTSVPSRRSCFEGPHFVKTAVFLF